MRALIVTYLLMALSIFAYTMIGSWLRVETLAEVQLEPEGRFELYTGKNGEHWWRLKGPNNQVIATGEGYPDKVSAESDIEAVRKFAGDAQTEELKAK